MSCCSYNIYDSPLSKHQLLFIVSCCSWYRSKQIGALKHVSPPHCSYYKAPPTGGGFAGCSAAQSKTASDVDRHRGATGRIVGTTVPWASTYDDACWKTKGKTHVGWMVSGVKRQGRLWTVLNLEVLAMAQHPVEAMGSEFSGANMVEQSNIFQFLNEKAGQNG